MAKQKFKENDVVVLNNPRKFWNPDHAKELNNEIALVRWYSGPGKYVVVHKTPSVENNSPASLPSDQIFTIGESEMIKIGVL